MLLPLCSCVLDGGQESSVFSSERLATDAARPVNEEGYREKAEAAHSNDAIRSARDDACFIVGWFGASWKMMSKELKVKNSYFKTPVRKFWSRVGRLVD